MDNWMHVKKQPAAARGGGAPGKPPTTAATPAQPPPPESPEAARATLANLFQSQYYDIMANTPASAYCFYYDESVVSHSNASDLSVTPPVTGIRDINDKILSSGLAHAQTNVTSIDHQQAASGVLVVVTGTVLLKGERVPRRFVQVFLLVNRSNSYYISNDVHRLLDLAPTVLPLHQPQHTMATQAGGLPGQPLLATPNGGPPRDPAVLAIATGPHSHVPAVPVLAPHAASMPAQLVLAAGTAAPSQHPHQLPTPNVGVTQHSPPPLRAPHAGAPPAPQAAQQQAAHVIGAEGADSGVGAGEGGKSSWAAVASKGGGSSAAQPQPQQHRHGGDFDAASGEADAGDAPLAAEGGVATSAPQQQQQQQAGRGGPLDTASLPVSLANLGLGADGGGGVGSVPLGAGAAQGAEAGAGQVERRGEARTGADGSRAPGAHGASANNSLLVVFVSSVPPSAEADDLKAAFAPHGNVRSVHWRKDKGFAFVEFATARDAQNVVGVGNSERGIVVGDVRVTVEPKRVTQQPSRGSGGGAPRGGGAPFARRGRGRGSGGEGRGGM